MAHAEQGGDSSPKKPERRTFDARARAAKSDFEAHVRQQRAELGARNERLTARTGRNLPAAIGIGVLFGVVMLASLLFWKPAFTVVAAVLIGVAAYELSNAMRSAGLVVPRVASVIAGVGVVPAAFWGGPRWALIELLVGILFVIVWRLVETFVRHRGRSAAELFRDLSAGLFVQAYVTLLGACTVLLTARSGGQFWTIGFIIVVVCVDTGAYASGLLLGRHPMAPRISPKKTWEGFGGSLVASMIAGVLVAWLMLDQQWWFGLVLGALVAGTATLGDLTESLVKRDLGIKDISTLLPGHGGLLDRIDSILPSAAVAYVLYLILMH